MNSLRLIISNLLAINIAKISPKLYMSLSYLHHRGRLPNLKKPKNISEIILSTICNGHVNEYCDYVDKIKVRDFYIKVGLEQHLPKIYGVWESINEIDFKNLPDAFALKTNHGCGNHYICKNKNDFDLEKARNIINKALANKYGVVETQYHLIRPMVFCEEYIDDGSGELPSDYKFLCLDGEIKCILIVTERTLNGYKLMTYNVEWEKLDYLKSGYVTTRIFNRPNNLKKMIKIATEIAAMFEFVRVDFYDIGERVIMGELTFTPQGGIMSYFTNEAIKIMGR